MGRSPIGDGQAARALRLAGASAALRQAYTVPAAPSERDVLDSAPEAALVALSAKEAAVARSAAQSITLQQAVAEALDEGV